MRVLRSIGRPKMWLILVSPGTRIALSELPRLVGFDRQQLNSRPVCYRQNQTFDLADLNAGVSVEATCTLAANRIAAFKFSTPRTCRAGSDPILVMMLRLFAFGKELDHLSAATNSLSN